MDWLGWILFYLMLWVYIGMVAVGIEMAKAEMPEELKDLTVWDSLVSFGLTFVRMLTWPREILRIRGNDEGGEF